MSNGTKYENTRGTQKRYIYFKYKSDSATFRSREIEELRHVTRYPKRQHYVKEERNGKTERERERDR